MTRDEQKQQMCDIGHRIWQKGFCAGNEGNHSIRVGENEVFCTPTGVSKGFLTPEMIVSVDLNGILINSNGKNRPTSEILLHLQLYKKRPDIRAVIHSHPPHATAFACAGIAVPEMIHPEAEFFLGKVRTAPYFTPGLTQVGQSVCDLIDAGTNTVLLGNHGSVNFADTLMEAYYKLEILDAYCRLLINLRQMGGVNVLTNEQMMELMEAKKKWGIFDARAEKGEFGGDNEEYFNGHGTGATYRFIIK